ncbi:MAG: 5-oxoprolinase subunit PxpA [Dehalococcoidales bacterium]|nr:5-oxoprolinase subunit PxpA [Dehalococcoidales bacterium]MDP6448715.1 5-oxoprolinase subunit PxpA [Dehalococcoidales bacterium]MDP6577152.1 5-oxoprolinase subunit PxpA [Dehalococcoidales bacterium]MDP6824555.1 5-oxoprolinase subunit PxpA [Dehalococcoidales bacterium]MDP7286330.1 5-oxoprolinase subunit PxpA [Dehalococcoidales bacterium]
MDFNCDLGESFGAYQLGFDEQLMPYISSANVACGFHAGDPVWMRRTVSLAEQSRVAVGAHPGLPDLVGFGRREMKVTPEEVKHYVIYQVGALQAFTRTRSLQHVKPHGALYNMGVANEEIARAVAEGVREADQRLILVGLAGSVWLNVGQQLGLKVASEVFADRALNPNGTLVPRSQPGAVIKDPEKVIAASLKMVTEGKTTAVNGQEITIRADTICLHSDTPGVVALARGLRERMEAAGVTVTPMSNFL